MFDSNIFVNYFPERLSVSVYLWVFVCGFVLNFSLRAFWTIFSSLYVNLEHLLEHSFLSAKTIASPHARLRSSPFSFLFFATFEDLSKTDIFCWPSDPALKACRFLPIHDTFCLSVWTCCFSLFVQSKLLTCSCARCPWPLLQAPSSWFRAVF